jgi:secondary thiamine-phosphate synthase enzyme
VKVARFQVETESKAQVVLVRDRVNQALSGLGAGEGLAHLWCPHTTAGLTVNEGWDPDVTTDLLGRLEVLVPWSAGYRHAEGNSAAHIKAALIGPGVTVPVEGGHLALGRWQDVYFCEFDGPRRRTVEVRYLEG